ncbi:MAG: aconitate hydratase [Alphaproteobacteria bacterium]
MALNLAQKLITDHLVDGEPVPGSEIAISIDQTLTQDATGTLVMLVLEALQIPRVKTALSAQYVDHNLLQEDNRNPDDHLFLRSACQRYGIWFSPPGNGVSHPVHMQRFGKPGATMLGADSHSCGAGALGMLAIGAGGLDVAMAMAGDPFHMRMPEIWGVRLTGALPDWVSAKDTILEMLRRHGVEAGMGRIIEYHGPGLDCLSTMDRHVIANMGAELGATTSVFPSDDEVRRFLASEGRADDWKPLEADTDAVYDISDEMDLSALEPLIAKPSSPGNVVPVQDVAGEAIYQSYIGSSANPGYRDFAVPAHMVAGRKISPRVSFDVNPTSRQLLLQLTRDGSLATLIAAGARLHQTGCNGCIGMGQAPATGRASLRTVPRNFPGRSGTREDRVYLCSPETATASALKGTITDPRDLGIDPVDIRQPENPSIDDSLLIGPVSDTAARETDLVKGPNITAMPTFDPLPSSMALRVLLKVGDDISTDEIMPAGARVLPFRSNISRISEFVFGGVDAGYVSRASQCRENGHIVVAGRNYGQGSSREHAAIAPRHLGLRVVIAKSIARIHRENLVNFGILPLVFVNPEDFGRISTGDEIRLTGLDGRALDEDSLTVRLEHNGGDVPIPMKHVLSPRQIRIIRAGGLINHYHMQRTSPA